MRGEPSLQSFLRFGKRTVNVAISGCIINILGGYDLRLFKVTVGYGNNILSIKGPDLGREKPHGNDFSIHILIMNDIPDMEIGISDDTDAADDILKYVLDRKTHHNTGKTEACHQ